MSTPVHRDSLVQPLQRDSRQCTHLQHQATLDEIAEGDGEGEGEGVEGIENEDNEYENPDTSMNQEED